MESTGKLVLGILVFLVIVFFIFVIIGSFYLYTEDSDLNKTCSSSSACSGSNLTCDSTTKTCKVKEGGICIPGQKECVTGTSCQDGFCKKSSSSASSNPAPLNPASSTQ